MKALKNESQRLVKNKGGRPAKKIKRSYILMTRLTATEKLLIEGRAKDAGMKPSEWFRKAAKSAKVVPRLQPQEVQVLKMLSGMANNLNQIAKQANSIGLLSVGTKCKKLLDEIESTIHKLFEHDRENGDW